MVAHRWPLFQPFHPASDRVDPSARPDRIHQIQDEPGDSFGVARSLGMIDGDLGQTVRFIPSSRPGVQLRHQVRISPPQLGQQ
jgi:hypothetical protein